LSRFLPLLALAAACRLPSHGSFDKLRASETDGRRAGRTPSGVVAAVGDIMLQEAVKDSAEAAAPGEAGYQSLWAPVAPLLAAPDLLLANLEGPVAPRGGGPAGPYVFNVPAEAIWALREAGFDVLAVTNNHAFDQGRAGFLETLQHLRAVGIAAAGAGPVPDEAGPLRLRAGGVHIALLAYASYFIGAGNACNPGEKPCVKAAILDPARVVEDVRAARAGADAVVVSLHWGEEYAAEPRPEDVALAHRLAEAGAVLILGHHPHVLQRVERYRRRDGGESLIAYSLGNFISNQARKYRPDDPRDEGAPRDAVLLTVELRGSPARLGRVTAVPLWTENEPPPGGRRAPRIRVVSLDRALAEVRSQLRNAAEGERGPLEERERLYLARKEAIDRALRL
jgi:poly-gamma-glutamate synthesis protein (capsule biosynthesis protein)